MKTIEKMNHVRRFDSCDEKKLSDIAMSVYSDCDDTVFVRGTHSYEWFGCNCVEEFGQIYEVHERNDVSSPLVCECGSIDELSEYFEDMLNYEEC